MSIETNSPEIKPHVYGQLIFSLSAKSTQWGKDGFFQQMILGKLDMLMQSNEIKPQSYTIPNN